MVRGQRIEHLGKMGRVDSVHLDPQGASRGKRHRLGEASLRRGASLLQQPDGAPGIGADLVHQGLLAIELFDHHQREHDIVLLESEQGGRIRQQDAGVEDVGVMLTAVRHLPRLAVPGARVKDCRRGWPHVGTVVRCG